MPKGRPAKPLSVLKAQGTDRPHRHASRESEPTSGSAVAMPDDLTDDGIKWWQFTVPKLEAMGVLDGVDTNALIGMANAWANWCNEQRKYEEGCAKITAVSAAWNVYDKIACRFGMTPVDRIKLATEAKEEEDSFEQWLSMKRSIS